MLCDEAVRFDLFGPMGDTRRDVLPAHVDDNNGGDVLESFNSPSQWASLVYEYDRDSEEGG